MLKSRPELKYKYKARGLIKPSDTFNKDKMAAIITYFNNGLYRNGEPIDATFVKSI